MHFMSVCVLVCPDGYGAAVPGRRVCNNPPLWNINSTECVNFDLCTLGEDNCDGNATCTYTGLQQFSCSCNLGYAGNGVHCGVDRDLDGFPDVRLNCTNLHCSADNCPATPNSGQEDSDGNGIGDICESVAIDSCVVAFNPTLLVTVNLTALGINSTIDRDDDKIIDICDNCQNDSNQLQSDSDSDGIGDICDGDIDGDGIPNDHDDVNGTDNCPHVYNPLQEDLDSDGVGDPCDNCLNTSNPSQLDVNGNSVGDECEADTDGDGDGVDDTTDNCQFDINPDQACIYCTSVLCSIVSFHFSLILTMMG